MNTPLTYEIIKEEGDKILSVKRVRDSRIYTIGDQTHYGKIIKFQIEKKQRSCKSRRSFLIRYSRITT